MHHALRSFQDIPPPEGQQNLVDLALAVVGARIVDDVLDSALAVLRHASDSAHWAILARIGPNRYQAATMPGIDAGMIQELAHTTCGKDVMLGVGGLSVSREKLEGPHWHAVSGVGVQFPNSPEIVLACWTGAEVPVPDEENLTRASMLIAGALHSAKTLESLVDQSSRDPLTHLLNRRGILDVLNREQDRATRYQRDLSILYIDLNHFKSINDLNGHGAGDAALESVAELLSRTVRTSDLVGRIGGDEFLVVLPDTTIDAAECIGNRLVQKMKKHVLEYRGVRLTLGLTFGASTIEEESRTTEMLNLADQRMLSRKRFGRKEFPNVTTSADQ